MVSRLLSKIVHLLWASNCFFYAVVGGQTYEAPVDYYDSADGLMGNLLKDALHDIIDDHNVRSYDDFKLAARALDQDPDNPDNIILLYSGESFPNNQFGASGEVWNREHLWPQSYGTDDTDENNTVGYSDMHHLYPALAAVNTERSNLYFDWTDPGSALTHPRAPGSSYDANSWEPRDEDKGRVARAILYMAVRYEGLADEKMSAFGATPPDLNLSDRPNSGSETMGKLTTLLEWNRLYQPDERERRRNQGIYEGVQWGTRTYRQGNRNPFTDHPEFADAIFTADAYITYGSWRIAHFTTDELMDPSLSSDLADPDADRLPNLVELAINSDPTLTTSKVPLSVDIESNEVVVSWTQLREAEKSGLYYVLEASTDPWNAESWSPLQETSSTPLDAFIEEVHYSESLPDEIPNYRLRIIREFPLDNPGEAVFDPATFAAAPGSIFAYEKNVGRGWRDSDWLSHTFTSSYPWIYHQMHRWLYLEADSPHSVWMFDEFLGWFWTRENIYPVAYSADREEWISFQGGTEPDRLLLLLESGLLVEEKTF